MVVDVCKTYELGAIKVRALHDITLQIDARRLRRDHGQLGKRQEHADEHPRVPGSCPRAAATSSTASTSREIDEDDLADLRNRKIGFVFQSFNLVARTSALANVELPLAYAGLDRRTRRERAQRALAAVGMAKRWHHQPSELSGGQQQRVAVARALVTNPTMILADEPTGNLDSRSTEEVLRIFAGLNAEGRTVVLITHEPDVAAQAKRVITLSDGRVIEDRRNAGVHDAPATPHRQKSAHHLYGGASR